MNIAKDTQETNVLCGSAAQPPQTNVSTLDDRVVRAVDNFMAGYGCC